MTIIGLFTMLFLGVEDVHSVGNPQAVYPTHLSLDLSLDFDKKVITGICELSLTYRDKHADHIDLDTRKLDIQKVTAANGDSLAFEMMPRKAFMGTLLRIQLKGTPQKIKVHYRTDPGAGALQWLSPAQTTSKKYPFLFTQSQPILARTWIPCMDSPGVRVSYDAVVRVPKEMKAVMSAVHGNHEPDKGIYRFELPWAIPTYLIALAAGEMEFQPLSDRTGVYAEPAVLKKAAYEFVDMEKMVKAAEDLYGSYRWKRWDTIVLPPSFPYGGMENPLLTFATPTILAGDRSLVSLMAHELAHSWSGNLVTNATWSDFWLNEGSTTYFERRIMEKLYGKEIAEMHWLLGLRDLRKTVEGFEKTEPGFNVLNVKLDGRDPDDAFSDIPYEKGANFLRVLEFHFGRAKFDTFLRNYFDSHAFQSITTGKFLEILKKDLFKGDESAWKKLQVDTWVFKGGIPDNIIVPKSDRFEKTSAAAAEFGQSSSLDLVKSDWVTSEWLDFLNSLPKSLSGVQMAKLDHTYKLSKTGNSEILFAWLMNCIRNDYNLAYPALEDFLRRQGRRKFLKPLYQAMMDNPKTRDMARRLYTQTRNSYHPISVNTLDSIVTY